LPLDISSKTLQLKALRSMATSITEKGALLFDLLEKEVDMRVMRYE
jgi:hypothetical protein